jgi:protein SCO1/2
MSARNKYKIIFIVLLAVLSTLALSMYVRSSQKEKPAISSLPVYNSADFTPVWLNESASGSEFHTIAPFSFTDQNGNTFDSKQLEGKIYAVDFFFTTCPGICPKLTKNLGKVQDTYLNDANVMLLSFSVTPETDNAEVLNNYAKNHSVNNNKWKLLTGARKDIYSLARKSFFADEDLGLQQNENDFLHTENVLLIDTKGRIRGIYKGTLPLEIEKLIKEIGILEKEG